jgi:hypothetical protein
MALTTKFSFKDPKALRQEVHAYTEMAGYYLRTRETDKAETFFRELQRPGLRPVFLISLGEVGSGILLSVRGDSVHSNDEFLKVAKLPPLPSGAVGPRGVFFAPEIRPFVFEALERNEKAGPLPEPLRELKRELINGPGPPR